MERIAGPTYHGICWLVGEPEPPSRKPSCLPHLKRCGLFVGFSGCSKKSEVAKQLLQPKGCSLISLTSEKIIRLFRRDRDPRSFALWAYQPEIGNIEFGDGSSYSCRVEKDETFEVKKIVAPYKTRPLLDSESNKKALVFQGKKEKKKLAANP